MRRPTLLTTPPAHRGAGPAAASISALAPGISLPLQCVVKLLCGAEGAAVQVFPCCGSPPSACRRWDPLPRLQLHPGLAFWLSHTPHEINMGPCSDVISPPFARQLSLLGPVLSGVSGQAGAPLPPAVPLSPPNSKDLPASFSHSLAMKHLSCSLLA